MPATRCPDAGPQNAVDRNIGLELEEARIRAAYARRQNEDRYTWFKPDYLYFAQERERDVLAALRRAGFSSLRESRILEVGCGTGHWLRELVKWGAQPENITGIDLLPDRVAEARRLCPEGVRIRCAHATALELPSDSFDVVLQSTMFSSILDDAAKRQAASEMIRVVKPGGIILWYDFWVGSPANPDVRGIRKPEIRRLFAGCSIELSRVTLAPPLCRAVAPYSRLACDALAAIPWCRTHYLGLIRRPR